MLFNSWIFWVFAGIVIPLYWTLSFKWQNRMLLVASYVFYGCWDWRFLILIAGSTVMDYYLGLAVSRANDSAQRKRLVAFSVVVNLGLLGFFKYYNFFSQEMVQLFNTLGLPVSLPILNVILPVGISFYTFQSMSYVIDIARGITAPAKSFREFALYVSFFPHLVAGPIMRSGNSEHGRGLLKQLEAARKWSHGDFGRGLYLIAIGLFKKVVIGDNMAPLANAIFQTPVDQLTGAECIAGVYAFAIQIYADFSGYSSIAQGVARWMGIDLMTNFRMPYLAVSPSDFWRRWHISLSTWLRDYVYVPAGGSRNSQFTTYRNLMLTMVLGGIWHGANWTFVAWGVFHGAILCAYRFAEQSRPQPAQREYSFVSRAVRVVVLFHLICVGWLLFRADSISQAWHMLALMLTDLRPTPYAISILSMVAFYAVPMLAFEFWIDRRGRSSPVTEIAWQRSLVYAYCAWMLLFFAPPTVHEFIYFQF
jgi:D-alanyl-lipoteichoic acid acyltransferase DltB (MBOAT superfamily)